ncbi:uncharacterized protein I206_104684 [Kwoniella pini CBS 10737]
MNTLSRLDSYVFSFFTFPSRSPSSSKIPLPRNVTPPPIPSSSTSSSSSSSIPLLNPNSSPRLSNLPPTPRPKSRRRPTPSIHRRKKGIITTYSSIKVPPPTTPILLRIALVLWSILLSFWTSLVGETRSGRSRTRKIRKNKSTSNGVGVLRELGESLMVSAGISESNNQLQLQQKQQQQQKHKRLSTISNEIEGSGSEIERELENSLNETSDEDEEDENWIDPLVTRAPSNQDSLEQSPPSDNDFTSTITTTIEDDEKRNKDHANFSFRLKSAQSKTSDLHIIDPSPPDTIRRKSSTLTSFRRQPSPPSILSNPIPKLSIPTITQVEEENEDSLTPVSSKTPTSTVGKKSSILANPISTSILDPTVPAPIKKNDSSIFRKTNLMSSTLSTTTTTTTGSINTRIPRSISTTPFHLQKTLILDLDETLIHSTSRPLKSLNGNGFSSSGGGGILGLSLNGFNSGNKFNRSNREGHCVEVVLNGRSTMYHVYKRPYVDHFLKKVAQWYTLVIFTASMPEYADPVIDWLDSGKNLFSKRFYRESCHLQLNGSYIKDLSLVEKDLSRICFMDNSPISYNWNKANALPIEGWTSDPNDEALLQSIPVLDSLRFVNDVRRVLGIRGFT